MCWRFEASACFRGTRGQATVEGSAAHSRVAFWAWLLQRSLASCCSIALVMEAAAAEGCRALETASAADEGEVVEYVQRRLGAVPLFPLSMRACGDIEVQVRGQSGQCVSVRISHGTGPCRSWGWMGLLGLVGSNGLCSPRGFSRDEHS